jgi:ATP-dependent RNA helicase RhlE
MPDTADMYTHRIGRTGRACNTGEAFTFINRVDEPIVRQVEKILGARIERRCLPGFAPEGLDSVILPGSGTPRDSLLQRQSRSRSFRLSMSGRKRRLRASH